MDRVKIGEIAKLYRGVSYKKEQARKTPCNGYIALLRANNITSGSFNYDDLVFLPLELIAQEQYINQGDIVITMSSGSKAHVGKVAIANGSMRYSYGAFCAKIEPTGVSPKFLYYVLRSAEFRMHIEQQCKGTNINNIKQSYILDYEIDLPSLPEQKRIVARIEELFSQLDSGVETLKKVKRQLAVYRQAVLKEAFEGRLTQDWRQSNVKELPVQDFKRIRIVDAVFKDTSGDENEIMLNLPDSWLKVRLGNVFQVEVGATPSRRKPEYWNGNINWVSSGEVHFNTITNTEECITDEGLNHASTNVHPVGTIMLAMIGEGKTRGQAAILNTMAAHNQNTAAILVSETPCDPKYIYYFLQLNYENTRRVGSGNNQKALNKERVRALRFPFTSFAEQALVVQEIESRMSVCDNVEQTVDTTLQQAEAMRQSILKKAFEGRLILCQQ